MTKAAKIFAVLAALECFGIMVLEMFYWEKAGMNVDPALSAEFLTQTVSMAANQGLYNGFLGLGIIDGMISRKKKTPRNVEKIYRSALFIKKSLFCCH